jgi:glycosyltransferase involved in cell wall biosynthesis/GR25 family glycosyltransferase involved in LPS biosynthesis
MGINFEYFEAVDGYDSKYDKLTDKVLKKEGTWIKSRGAVGLLLTYMKLLEDAMAKGYDNILILEDDICFHKDFDNLFEKAVKNINFNEIDCYWLGANQYRYDPDQKKQLDDPNCEYYTVSRQKWCYTFGTYAIAMNKNLIQCLRKSLILDDVIYGIDVHIFWLLANNKMNGRILRPFLILPDVTDSDNMGVRDQNSFALERMYSQEDYLYVSLSDIAQFKKLLDMKRVSLRQIFSEYSSGNMMICRNSLHNAIGRIKNFNESDMTFAQKLVGQIYDIFVRKDRDMMNIMDLFGCLEEKKNFVLIVPSYNNINNYQINLESIRRQIYPHHQMRVIYVNDCSDDGTDQAVRQYITNNQMEDQITYIDMSTRQRQGMARFLAFHKCFDDEICLNLDGDDWLYDEFVLDNMDKHFTENDILVSYGSYYVYDENNVSMGQMMGMPYNNKLLNMRQYPDEVKMKKTFRHYDWICGHLRSGYAKLFKSIELKHYIGPDNNFLRMSSDFGEMYPVLEMSQNRNLNIMKPTVVYNKYNSKQFETSYYNMDNRDNVENKKYREQVVRMIRSRPYYPRFSGSIVEQIGVDQSVGYLNLDLYKTLDDKNLPELIDWLKRDTNRYINISDNEMQKMPFGLIKLIGSQPSAVLINPIQLNDHNRAVIDLDTCKYVVTRIDWIKNGMLAGFYDRTKLIEILMKNPKFSDEVVLQPIVL